MTPPAPAPEKSALVEYFDSMAPQRDRWIERNRYYHDELERIFSFFILRGRSVIVR